MLKKYLIGLGVLFLADIAFAQEYVKSPSFSFSATQIVNIQPHPEIELEKKKAEAIDICLRIFRNYGHVEVIVVGTGNEAFAICK